MDINARLAKLERENRRMKKIGTVAAVFAAVLFVSGQAKTNKSLVGAQKLSLEGKAVVEANEFRLVDASGKVHAELTMVSGEPKLSFRDGNGDEVAALGTNGDSPNLSLGKDKSSRAFLGAGSPSGWPGPYLSLIPVEGRHGSVAISAGTQGMLTVFGPAGSVSVHTDEDFGGPNVTVTDKEGYSGVVGRTDLETIGTGRKTRTPAASVVLFGKDKKVLWSAP